MTIVAYNTKRIIKEKGLKQGFVAERANLTDKQLSAMLCGRKIIFADVVPQIAAALDVSVNELYAPMEVKPT